MQIRLLRDRIKGTSAIKESRCRKASDNRWVMLYILGITQTYTNPYLWLQYRPNCNARNPLSRRGVRSCHRSRSEPSPARSYGRYQLDNDAAICRGVYRQSNRVYLRQKRTKVFADASRRLQFQTESLSGEGSSSTAAVSARRSPAYRVTMWQIDVSADPRTCRASLKLSTFSPSRTPALHRDSWSTARSARPCRLEP